MRLLLGAVAAAMLVFASGQAVRAEDTMMFPDAHGKMVRIHIAHSYEQCRKNGHNLGYPDSDSHAWCSQHCKGTICR